MIDYSMPDHVYHKRRELSSTGARRIRGHNWTERTA